MKELAKLAESLQARSKQQDLVASQLDGSNRQNAMVCSYVFKCIAEDIQLLLKRSSEIEDHKLFLNSLYGKFAEPEKVPRSCAQEGCTMEAHALVHWPGSDLIMCKDHMLKAVRIATAMGFELSCEPV